jgi:hypothetical protein
MIDCMFLGRSTIEIKFWFPCMLRIISKCCLKCKRHRLYFKTFLDVRASFLQLTQKHDYNYYVWTCTCRWI